MAGKSTHQTIGSGLVDVVKRLYPEALCRTYIVPPVHFNRVPYDRVTVPGTGQPALQLREAPHDADRKASSQNQPGVQSSASGQNQSGIKSSASGQNQPGVQSSASGQNQPGIQSSTTGDKITLKVHSGTEDEVSPPQSVWPKEPQPQSKPRSVRECDLQDDFTQQHVLANLQELEKQNRKEVMFVVSELNFKDYLNQPDYAKLTGKLPKPANLPKEQRHLGKQGDFDILVIHREHGILVGEIKSVGRTEASRADSEVVKKIKDAVKQLDKCEAHVRHMVSDIAPGLTVRKTLFLPYVSRAQLQRILDDENNSKLQQMLCQGLCAATTAEAIELCCCSDQLSQPASYWDVTPAVLSQLSTWWQHRMACTLDPLLTDDLYLDIVARFVGPATACSVHCNTPARVAVRTEGEAVSELGWRLALLVLTLQQIDLLNRNPQRVCILGPPGTGKTVVLVLQGLRWLLQGHDVQVISARNVNWAIGRVITEQLRLSLQMSLSADQTPSTTPGEVAYYQYDFREREEDVEKALTELTACVKDGQLHLLMDEATLSKSDEEHRRLVTELTRRVPHVFIWSTGIMCTDVPAELQSENFTVPLRCAPAVLREVQPGFSMFMGVVDNYSIRDGVPAPGDGLRVVKLIHEGIAHTGRWPVDCTQCGGDIATELRRLGVGTGGNLVKNSPEPLSYRDVFVLTRSPHLQDDVTDDAGNVMSPTIGVVRGLRKAGLPVCVLEEQRMIRDKDKWERDLRDVAMAATDRVTVAHYRYVTGMERRVVAVVPGKAKGADEMDSDQMTDAEDRMYSVSRCTTQLILVEVPGKALTSGLDRKFGSAGGPDKSKKSHEEQKKDATGVSWVKKKGFLL